MKTLEKLDELFKSDILKQNKNIYVDKITGLLNMVAFQTVITELALSSINDYINNCSPCSIIICDLNYLKNINDQFGHIEGNKALKQISKILLSCVKNDKILNKFDLKVQNNKLVFRVGGDEFLIILRNTNKKEAEIIKKNIKIKTNAYKNRKFFLSVATGISSIEDIKIKNINKNNIKKLIFKMLEIADEKMFEDKLSIKLNLSKNKKDKLIMSYLLKIYDLLQLDINKKSDIEILKLKINEIINKTVTK